MQNKANFVNFLVDSNSWKRYNIAYNIMKHKMPLINSQNVNNIQGLRYYWTMFKEIGVMGCNRICMEVGVNEQD